MTVEVMSRRVEHITNGVTVRFPVPFPFFELEAYFNDELLSATDYSIDQEEPGQEGDILFSPAPPAGVLVIVGATEADQQIDFITVNEVEPEAVEDGLDRLTMIAQETRAVAERSVRVGPSRDALAPIPSGEGYLYLDADGTPVLVAGTDSPDLTLDVDRFSTRTAAAAATIPGSVAVILTLSYATAGDGGGARYVRTTALDTLKAFTSADGAHWKLDVNQPINVRMFGAKGDLSVDDQPAIQSTIDWCIQKGIQEVHVPEGSYRVDDVIHLGYGNSFIQIALLGASRGSYSQTQAGTRLISTKSDRPVVNFQGTRSSRVAGISFIGKAPTVGADPYLKTKILGLWSDPAFVINESPATWNDATNTATAIDRYRPYAAVTIDAYAGTRPGSSYPDAVYPSWTGISTQWGKSLSSATAIDDCSFNGFGVAVCTQPSGGDGNGDFVSIDRANIIYCIYGIAVVHTQGRNTAIRDCAIGSTHTGLTNRVFGQQTGKMSFVYDNLHVGACYQVFDFGSQGSNGSAMFNGCYSEAICRIGTFSSGDAYLNSIHFNSCQFIFADQKQADGGAGRAPKYHLEVTTFAGVKFSQCNFATERFFTVGAEAGGVTYEDCVWQTMQGYIDGRDGTPVLGIAHGVNCFGGVFDVNRLGTQPSKIVGSNAGPLFSVSSLGTYAGRFYGEESKEYLHQGSRVFVDSLGQRWPIQYRAGNSVVANTAWTVYPSISGTTMTGTYANSSFANSDETRLEPGDVLWEDSTGNLFMIETVTLSGSDWAIQAILLNNFTVNTSDVKTFVTQCATGNWYIHKATSRLPRTVWFGDFTSGSANVTSVHRGDSFGASMAGSDELYVGMALKSAAVQDTTSTGTSPVWSGTKIATLTAGSPGSLTLTKNAVLSGRFPIFPAIINRAR